MGKAAVERKLLQAAEHFNAGRPDQADALCADVLKSDPDHISALHLSAVIAFVSDRAAEGAKRLSRVLSLAPNHAPALATLGDALAVKGEREGAADAFRSAVAVRPKDASLHAKLGAALCDLSRFKDAETSLRQALMLNPGHVRARFNLGVALSALKRFAEAETVYRDVLARDPACHGAWLNLGNVLAELGKGDDAVEAYRQALVTDPDNAGLLRNLGTMLHQQGQLDDAIAHYRKATALAPDDNAALRFLGIALHEAGQLEEAAKVYRQSALDPADHIILSNLAACLADLGQYDEAMAASELALAIKPDHAPAQTNRGIILEMRGEFDAAVAAHRRAVEIDPTYAKGHANLAVTLRSAGLLDEALLASFRAVELNPEHALTRYNHAHALLMNGHLAAGFEEFRWGRKCKTWSHHYPDFSQPEWAGENFAGRTLLVFSDYGIGDALQLVRYMPEVVARGGDVVLQIQPSLVPLLHDQLPGVTVIARGEPLPRFDLQLPMMGLPYVFGTTLETIPTAVPYLQADPVKLARWRRALSVTEKLKVGVAWAGNVLHKGDKQRSIEAEAVLPRLVMPGVQLYSLQKEPRETDRAVFDALGADLTNLAPALGDFGDTAAAVEALDLVISVDTSVAHLAGSLGCPIWVLLPYALDWRWMRDRADTPWYPTMRLFRQDRPREWDGAIARLRTELAHVAAGDTARLWPALPDVDASAARSASA